MKVYDFVIKKDVYFQCLCECLEPMEARRGHWVYWQLRSAVWVLGNEPGSSLPVEPAPQPMSLLPFTTLLVPYVLTIFCLFSAQQC